MKRNSSIEIEQSKETKSLEIFIQPEMERTTSSEAQRKVETFCLIADGTNRTFGLNAGYKEAGKNVVRLAEYLARETDVSTFIACIVSPDNREHRSEEFFWKMYQAFLGLGISIDEDKTFLKDGIRLEVEGTLEHLKQKGGAYKLFAYAVEAVCKKTQQSHLVTRSSKSLTLKLGIDYTEVEADVVSRTGMKLERTARLSGLKLLGESSIFGSATLFPLYTPEDLQRDIERAERTNILRAEVGHNKNTIVSLAKTPIADGVQMNLHVPFTGNLEELANEMAAVENELTHSVMIFSAKGKIISTFGPANASTAVIAFPAGSEYLPQSTSYTHFIAPGQPEPPFNVSKLPALDHATIVGSGHNVESIVNAIRISIELAQTEELLQGGDRVDSKRIRLDQFLKELRELEELDVLFEECTVRELEQCLAPLEAAPDAGSFENFKRVEKLVLAFFLKWLKRKGLDPKSETYFRAFRSYVGCALLMSYWPQYPEMWQKNKTHWVRRLFGACGYFLVTFKADDSVTDFQEAENSAASSLEVQGAKADLRETAIPILCEAVEGKRPDRNTIPEVSNREEMIAVAELISELRRDLRFEENQNQLLVQEFTQRMQNLFGSTEREWTHRPIDVSAWEAGAPMEDFRSKVKASAFLSKKVEGAILKMRSEDEKLRREGEAEWKLYQYLVAIEDSIGAGITFRMLAACEDRGDVDDEAFKAYQELCLLMNLYYRIANDISGNFSREYADRETKADCCHIMASRYAQVKDLDTPREIEAFMSGVLDLKSLLKEIHPLIEELQKTLIEKWPTIGIAVAHTIIAQLIYKNAHFRTVSDKELTEYQRATYHCAR